MSKKKREIANQKGEIIKGVIMDTRTENLPKWARERIALLEMRLREANVKLLALFPDAKTDTFWDESYESKHPLPPGARIRFVVGKGELDFLDVRLVNGGLEVQGADTLSITPCASNSIKVHLSNAHD